MRARFVQTPSPFHRCLAWSRRHPADAGFIAASGGLVVLGFFLRSNGFWFHPLGLWGDESFLALGLSRQSIGEMVMRPVGFTGFAKLCTAWFGYDERTLRLLSYLTSVAMLLVAPFAGRYAFKSRLTAALLVALVALHPALIDYAKEFKPYATETFVHFGLVTLLLAYWKSRSRAVLYGLAVAAPLGFLFAYNAIFLYPALFLLWGIDVLRARQFSRLWVIVPSAVACLVAPAILYAVAWSSLDKGEEEGFWGQKYNAFYLDEGEDRTPETRVDWVLKRYSNIVAMPGMDSRRWPSMTEDDTGRNLKDAWYYLWVALHVGGIASLVNRKRYEFVTLLVLPLLVALGFNQLGRWPFNSFRVNLFMLTYLLFVACAVFDGFVTSHRRWVSRSGRVAAVALVCLPYVLFGFDWHWDKSYWTTSTDMVTAMNRIREEREKILEREPGAPPETILLDAYSCGPMKYYSTLDTKSLRRHGDFFGRNFTLLCPGSKLVKQARKQEQPFWVMLAMGADGNRAKVRTLKKSGKIRVDFTPCRAQRVLRLVPKRRRSKRD